MCQAFCHKIQIRKRLSSFPLYPLYLLDSPFYWWFWNRLAFFFGHSWAFWTESVVEWFFLPVGTTFWLSYFWNWHFPIDINLEQLLWYFVALQKLWIVNPILRFDASRNVWNSNLLWYCSDLQSWFHQVTSMKPYHSFSVEIQLVSCATDKPMILLS